jgi:hypothetical protein
MGNRAVITTAGAGDNPSNFIGIYLHWNGGPESVLAFLETAKNRHYRSPDGDESYGMARLVGVIHDFFGADKETSVGIGMLDHLDTDNWDNGVYQVGKDWKVISRWGKGSDGIKTVDELSPDQKQRFNGIVEYLDQHLQNFIAFRGER